MTVFTSPKTIEEALGLLSSGVFQVLAGGTDIYPASVGKPMRQPFIDISGIASMKQIVKTPDHWRIGGAVSWSDFIKAELPTAFDGLKLAANEVGAKQIQNVGTIAGNLCNASPAADGVPPLLTLDAKVELASSHAVRHVALTDFILGNRQTLLQPNEILTAILIPSDMDSAHSHFQKLGSRSYLVISIVMVACLLDADENGVIRSVKISVGACSAVAKRLYDLETALIGKKVDSASQLVQNNYFDCLTPIDDVRASASYRLKAAQEMVKRSLLVCGKGQI